MSGLFSSCFAAIATLLKKQKPIAFNVMLMVLAVMVVLVVMLVVMLVVVMKKLLNFSSQMKISHLFCLGMVARWANQGKPVRELQFEISSGEEWGKSEAVFYHQKKTGS